MKRFVSTALVVVLLLGLGTLAVLARGGGDILTPAGNVAAAQPQTAAAPEAPAATIGWNAIALPLDMSGSVTMASQLKAHIQSFCPPATPCPNGVARISRWDSVNQKWVTWAGTINPPDFPVYPGQALLIGINAGTAIGSTAILGNVPPQCPATGCIQYGISSGLPALVSTGWNFIMIPLDKTGPTTADALMTDMDASGKVTKVSTWDAPNQKWTTRTKGTINPANYAVSTGYPYLVYSNGTSTTTWPTTWP
jgi:hypothetical protein